MGRGVLQHVRQAAGECRVKTSPVLESQQKTPSLVVCLSSNRAEHDTNLAKHLTEGSDAHASYASRQSSVVKCYAKRAIP